MMTKVEFKTYKNMGHSSCEEVGTMLCLKIMNSKYSICVYYFLIWLAILACSLKSDCSVLQCRILHPKFKLFSFYFCVSAPTLQKWSSSQTILFIQTEEARDANFLGFYSPRSWLSGLSKFEEKAEGEGAEGSWMSTFNFSFQQNLCTQLGMKTHFFVLAPFIHTQHLSIKRLV